MSTLENAASVLRLFTADRLELTVTDVARALGLPKSSVSRLLKAMRDSGLLTNVAGTPRYRVGTLLFEIAQLHQQNSPLMDLAEAELRAICQDTRHTGYISILDGTDVLVLRMHPGREALRVVTPLGSRAAAFATANGRALLARLGNDKVRSLHPNPLRPPSANAPADMTSLLDRLAQARRVGWCEAINEAIPDVHSIAVAVEDAANAETFAFCLSFPDSKISQVESRSIVRALTDAARRIAEKVGDRYWQSLPAELAA
ncbi:MAG TPA: IclR family transcriptional regulator [Rhodopila sp.]|nr:IclR family transcriptional regulator [Rhodopila sp.]